MKENQKFLDEIVGKIFPQHCGDSVLVLNEIKLNKKGRKVFKIQFQKYFYEDWKTKAEIIGGTCKNPQIEIEEFVNILWPQNCGEIVKVLEKVLEGPNKGKWKIEYQKYHYIDYKTKTEIKLGRCINPLIEENEFIGCIFPQKCGDSLKVLRKTKEKQINSNGGTFGNILFECEFQKYPYKVKAIKSNIIKGNILNPRIEIEEFINKEWPQNCGDSLKVLRKTNEREICSNGKLGNILYECEFIKYPYKIKRTKGDIITGQCFNPEIERIEFWEAIHPQHCGDSLKVIKKENYKDGDYIECIFINHPCKVLATKSNIKAGKVLNPQIELDECIGKEFPQKCGDILVPIEKTNQKDNSEEYLWRCRFKSNGYEVLIVKSKFEKFLNVNNPNFIDKEKIIDEEIVGKYFEQNCGDTLLVLNEYIVVKNGKKNVKKFKCQFQKHFCEIFASKSTIIRGVVNNPQIEIDEFVNKIHPQNCGDFLRILRKITKGENKGKWEAEFINYSCKVLELKYIIEQGLVRNPKAPNYKGSSEEDTLREYIKSIYSGEVIKNFGNTKEYNYYEADIYLPKLKLAIEYNGSVWHEEGNPNNPFSKPIGYHKNKRKFFESLGIKMYFIWDYEWFEDKKHTIISESCKERVKNIIESKII